MKLLWMILLLSISWSLKADNIFIEAESFDNKGGWVLDNQSMKQMGSSYLLAHGLGIPVKMLQQSSKLRIRENTEFGSEREIGLRNGIRQPPRTFQSIIEWKSIGKNIWNRKS